MAFHFQTIITIIKSVKKRFCFSLFSASLCYNKKRNLKK
ncbi:hypothetical protein STRMA_0907 [Streptococcus macacae NCTC 11558]|uniref:Uncharacterized protein n=1 Tax=Streptococcus macacae NCTC 11558 TaxID=764298 RepID=G5JVQ1_9STRE|nr:hypothetical protein STRMA_0907 [Streptococcus macacae NCTC 11558]